MMYIECQIYILKKGDVMVPHFICCIPKDIIFLITTKNQKKIIAMVEREKEKLNLRKELQ